MEYVWVMGASGSEKKTLITNIHKNNNLKEHCRLEGSVKSYEPSLNDTRTEPLDIEDLANQQADHILIKWQWNESKNNNIIKLKNKRHDWRHRIILLNRPTEETVRDLNIRNNHKGRSWTVEEIEKEILAISAEISHLRANEFEVMEIDSSIRNMKTIMK